MDFGRCDAVKLLRQRARWGGGTKSRLARSASRAVADRVGRRRGTPGQAQKVLEVKGEERLVEYVPSTVRRTSPVLQLH